MEPERRNPRLGIEQSRALKGRKERWGKPGGEIETGSTETGGKRGKPGQPQLTPWAAGIFPGLHYTTAGNIPLTLARGVSPGWSHPGPFLSALGRSPAAARGLGWAKKSAVPTGRSPSYHSPKPSHASFKFLTHTPSTRSSCLQQLTLLSSCYSGPVRAPAFRKRQTGAPRPGYKSSPWPPSVSRSTDRVR